MTATATATESLQTAIDKAGGPVDLLRRSAAGQFAFPGIPAEFTNWIDEQLAARTGCLLAEQSYHMTELHLRGSGVAEFLMRLAVNDLRAFPTRRAKQIVLAGHDGNLVSDAIVFREEEDFFRIVGAPFASDWVQYNAEQEEVPFDVVRDDNWVVRQGKGPRDVFRIQLGGASAHEVLLEASDGTLPEIRFFRIGEFTIAGHTVRALGHGMSDASGFEVYGPWDVQQAVRERIEEVGSRYGLRKGGSLNYSANSLETGWMGIPVPAIYHSEEMRPYREWLPKFSLEGLASLGGSLVSDNIAEYYMDPVELGYKRLIDFDHEFVGRSALQEKVANQTRTKVTLIWNEDDVTDVIRSSLFPAGKARAKFLRLPAAYYATFQADAVQAGHRRIGISQIAGYQATAEAVMSLALVDIEHSEPGTEVTLLWGEPDSPRITVETHEVREIRATVAPSPYHKVHT